MVLKVNTGNSKTRSKAKIKQKVNKELAKMPATSVAIRSLNRQIKRLQPEIHYIDDANSGYALDYLAYFAQTQVPGQGVGDTQRDGDSIRYLNMTFRYGCEKNPAIASSVVRVIVLWDEQNRVTAANQVLQVIGTNNAPFSPKLYDTRFQTKFLYDKTHCLTDVQNRITREVTIPINKHCQFLAGAQTVTTGSLKFLFVSDIAGGSTPVIQWQARMTFMDS